MDKFKKRLIGNCGRQDSEYDNTLAEWGLGDIAPQQKKSAWKLVLLILALVPWSLILLLFARYRFMLHSH